MLYIYLSRWLYLSCSQTGSLLMQLAQNAQVNNSPLVDCAVAIGVNEDKGNLYSSVFKCNTFSWEYLWFLCSFWRLGICSGKMKICFTLLLGIGDPLVYLPSKLKSPYFIAKTTPGIYHNPFLNGIIRCLHHRIFFPNNKQGYPWFIKQGLGRRSCNCFPTDIKLLCPPGFKNFEVIERDFLLVRPSKQKEILNPESWCCGCLLKCSKAT